MKIINETLAKHEHEIIEDDMDDQVQEMINLLKRVLVLAANGTEVDLELVTDIAKMLKKVNAQNNKDKKELEDLKVKAERWC